MIQLWKTEELFYFNTIIKQTELITTSFRYALTTKIQLNSSSSADSTILILNPLFSLFFSTNYCPQILINFPKCVYFYYHLYMKASTLVLILALSVLIATDSVSAGSNPQKDNKAKSAPLNHHRLPAKNERNQNNIYEFVDHAIKEKYWYYLTKACLVYLTSVDQGNNSYQFLAIYRNIVGTFLAITTWTKGASNFQVNTLVRLGDGDARKLGANYKPIAVRPLQLRYSLGANEVVIEFTDSYDIKVDGKCIECNQHEEDRDLCVKECKELNSLAQNKFWYYLEHAKVIYSNVAKTSSRHYCLITYLNEVGTFLVIGSKSHGEKSADSQVNTFVRLGNGCASGVQYKPTSFNKIKLPLVDFSD